MTSSPGRHAYLIPTSTLRPVVDIPGVLDVPPKITKEGSEGAVTGDGFWKFFGGFCEWLMDFG